MVLANPAQEALEKDLQHLSVGPSMVTSACARTVRNSMSRHRVVLKSVRSVRRSDGELERERERERSRFVWRLGLLSSVFCQSRH